MKYLNKTVEYILAIILAVMSFSMAVNVFCRSCLGFSLSWADELSQSLLVWLTFLGAAIAVRDYSHYSFNFIQQSLKGKWALALTLFSQLMILGCALLMLVEGTKITRGIAGWLMPAMGISRAWIYGACPVGSALMILYSSRNIAESVKRYVSTEKQSC